MATHAKTQETHKQNNSAFPQTWVLFYWPLVVGGIRMLMRAGERAYLCTHTPWGSHGSFLIRRQRGHPGVVLQLVICSSANH